LLRRARLPAGLVGRLLPLVHGNPGYAEAYVRVLAESGVPGDDIPVPEVVRAAVAARIDRLAGPDRAGLLVACAVGPVVSGELMAYLLRTTYDEAHRVLRRLADAGMLAACPALLDDDPRYGFADPAVCTVAYARLSRRARADLQRRMAEWRATDRSVGCRSGPSPMAARPVADVLAGHRRPPVG
jgi:predicted ATPase